MRAFEHRGLGDGDEVDLGGLRLRALATPGHTDEHLSFLLLDGSTPLGVFTGGSLIVGAAARTDLCGEERTVELAAAQYASVHRLAALPDQTAVGRPTAPGRSARPHRARPVRAPSARRRSATRCWPHPTSTRSVARLVGSLGSYPAYFRWLAEVNRRGPACSPPNRAAGTVERGGRVPARRGRGRRDVRPVPEVAAGHIPGAIAIPLRAQFATWLGWLVDPWHPRRRRAQPGQDPADILWPALDVGFDRIVGQLGGGMAAWTGEVATTRLVDPAHVDRPVLDIRQAVEYGDGHVPGAVHLELGSLPTPDDAAPDGPTVVMCGHGERAMTAATLLERRGRRDVAVLVGGPTTGPPPLATRCRWGGDRHVRRHARRCAAAARLGANAAPVHPAGRCQRSRRWCPGSSAPCCRCSPTASSASARTPPR
jgi:rhodanese-related sulfurtransferase